MTAELRSSLSLFFPGFYLPLEGDSCLCLPVVGVESVRASVIAWFKSDAYAPCLLQQDEVKTNTHTNTLEVGTSESQGKWQDRFHSQKRLVSKFISCSANKEQ